MNTLQFTTIINSTRKKVWGVLWSDVTFRDWASNIDEGTYMDGEMIEGQLVRFISSESGYGIDSLIEKLIPNEMVVFRHLKDTKDSGKHERESEWTGGNEEYYLTEKDGVTTLSIKTEVPEELESMFQDRVPKALDRIKVLAEGSPSL